MKINSSNFKKYFCLAVLSTFLTLGAYAQDNVISSVMISKSKEKPNSYELNIDSTDVVPYKTNVEQDGSVYFDLKNSVLAQDAGTIYDDVSNIDNVVVRQLEKNKVRIYVKGKNAKNTELVFVNSLFDTTQNQAKKIILNRPVNEYQSVNNTESEDLEEQDEIQNWDDNSFNLYHLCLTFLKNLKQGPMGMILIIMFVIGIGAIIIKTLASKLSQEREPLIKLNSKNTTGFNLENNFQTENYDLESIANRNEALRNAQIELTKAHQKYQEYMQNKYNTKPKQKTSTDSIKKGIALSQYQKSTQNPYKNQPVLKINKDFTQSLKQTQGHFQIPPRPKMQSKTNYTTPYIKKNPINNNIGDIKKQKQTNMKFLESVTKIYEQSGREDLANELKNSISKAKQTI